MSDLYLPPNPFDRDFTRPEKVKLFVAAVSAASYARMVHLGWKGFRQEVLTEAEQSDLRRLMNWWNNLGEEQKDLGEEWIAIVAKYTEDVTMKSGREALKKMSKWKMGE